MVVLQAYHLLSMIFCLILKKERAEHKREQRPVRKMIFRSSKADYSIIKLQAHRSLFYSGIIMYAAAIMKSKEMYQSQDMQIGLQEKNSEGMKIIEVADISAAD